MRVLTCVGDMALTMGQGKEAYVVQNIGIPSIVLILEMDVVLILLDGQEG